MFRLLCRIPMKWDDYTYELIWVYHADTMNSKKGKLTKRSYFLDHSETIRPISDWWFGTWFFFPFHIWDNPSQLTFIFFRGVETTNQMMYPLNWRWKPDRCGRWLSSDRIIAVVGNVGECGPNYGKFDEELDNNHGIIHLPAWEEFLKLSIRQITNVTFGK